MLKELFEKLSKENRAALVTFISCGDPNLAFTEKLVKRVCESGSDIVELGVPFSDPMADGPTIQAASLRALRSGTNIVSIIEMVARLRKDGVKNPFVLFSYYNPIFVAGKERIAKLSKECGVNAWLVVDAPLEESAEILEVTKPNGLDFIPLAAPTTPLERIAKLAANGSGFLYYITVSGVTGARKALPAHFAERLREVRKVSSLPVAAGFGISTPEMARSAALDADAVVVGSRFVDLAHKTYMEQGEDAALDAAGEFISSLASQMQR